jgi:plastocyanin
MSGRRNRSSAAGLGLLLAACLLALQAGCGDDGPTNPPGGDTIDVEVVDFSFQPVMVNARVGDTIRWTQRSEIPHTATSGEPGAPDQGVLFDLGLEETGDVEEFEVTEAGTIPYFCLPHPFMTGSIVVAP